MCKTNTCCNSYECHKFQEIINNARVSLNLDLYYFSPVIFENKVAILSGAFVYYELIIESSSAQSFNFTEFVYKSSAFCTMLSTKRLALNLTVHSHNIKARSRFSQKCLVAPPLNRTFSRVNNSSTIVCMSSNWNWNQIDAVTTELKGYRTNAWMKIGSFCRKWPV